MCDGDAPSRATTVVDGRELIPSPTAFNATTLNAYVPRRKFEILERRKKKKEQKRKNKKKEEEKKLSAFHEIYTNQNYISILFLVFLLMCSYHLEQYYQRNQMHE